MMRDRVGGGTASGKRHSLGETPHFNPFFCGIIWEAENTSKQTRQRFYEEHKLLGTLTVNIASFKSCEG